MYEFQFLASLAKTIFVELVVLYLLLRYVVRDTQTPLSRILGAGVFASLMTLPYLWFIAPVFLKNFFWYVLVGEVVVFFVEGVFYGLYFPTSLKKAFFYSFVCNLLSFLVGLYI